MPAEAQRRVRWISPACLLEPQRQFPSQVYSYSDETIFSELFSEHYQLCQVHGLLESVTLFRTGPGAVTVTAASDPTPC